MNKDHQHSHTIKFPIHLIEEKFGSGNFDDAADSLVNHLTSIVKKSNYTIKWSFDNTHTNPWYHTFNLTIQGLSDSEISQLLIEATHIGILNK